jgi:hypothetical protein
MNAGLHAITWHSTASRSATTVRTQHENKQYIQRCAIHIQAKTDQQSSSKQISRLHGSVMLTLHPGAAAPSFALAPPVRTATKLPG